MTKTESALQRLDAALEKLEMAVDSAAAAAEQQKKKRQAPAVDPEREKLEAEVRALRERAKEDARLREEAASAVRDALTDLRTIVAIQNDQGAPANA